MKAPKDITEVRRFFGMVNQLGKLSQKIAELTKPLRDLLSAKNQWRWGDAQQQAFSIIKENLTSTPTLAHYNLNLETALHRCISLCPCRSTNPETDQRPVETNCLRFNSFEPN